MVKYVYVLGAFVGANFWHCLRFVTTACYIHTHAHTNSHTHRFRCCLEAAVTCYSGLGDEEHSGYEEAAQALLVSLSRPFHLLAVSKICAADASGQGGQTRPVKAALFTFFLYSHFFGSCSLARVFDQTAHGRIHKLFWTKVEHIRSLKKLAIVCTF